MSARDWADERAEVIASAMGCKSQHSVPLIASSLRLARAEGERAGIQQMGEAAQRVFDDALGKKAALQ